MCCSCCVGWVFVTCVVASAVASICTWKLHCNGATIHWIKGWLDFWSIAQNPGSSKFWEQKCKCRGRKRQWRKDAQSWDSNYYIIPRHSMYGIFYLHLVNCMVNVDKYSVHWVFGIVSPAKKKLFFSSLFQGQCERCDGFGVFCRPCSLYTQPKHPVSFHAVSIFVGEQQNCLLPNGSKNNLRVAGSGEKSIYISLIIGALGRIVPDILSRKKWQSV